MFIQTEETPNPNTLKFIPGVPVFLDSYQGYHTSYTQEDDLTSCPMAKKLLALEGIKNVFLGADFITVAKDDDIEWYVLKPHILGIIMQQFINNLPVIIVDGDVASFSKDALPLDELSKKIVEMLDERIRPAVAMDGGDILFDRFENGVVYLKMRGACAGCPSSTATLKNGIETMLKFYIPEVQEVVQSYD